MDCKGKPHGKTGEIFICNIHDFENISMWYPVEVVESEDKLNHDILFKVTNEAPTENKWLRELVFGKDEE